MMSAKMAASDVFDFDRKRKMRRRITLELKMEVLRRIEAGERQSDVSRSFGIPESSIRTIWKNADAVRIRSCFAPSLLAKQLTRFRSNLVERMEVMLSEWIDEQPDCGNIPLSVVMGRARSIFYYLKQDAGPRAAQEQFTASRGWYHRFKRRMSLRVMAEGQKGRQFGCRVINASSNGLEVKAGKGSQGGVYGVYPPLFECKVAVDDEGMNGEDEQDHGVNEDAMDNTSSEDEENSLVPQPLNIKLEPQHHSTTTTSRPDQQEELVSTCHTALELPQHQTSTSDVAPTEIIRQEQQQQQQRNLPREVLSEGLGKIYEALELFSKNDPDWYRSTQAKENVLNSLFCYTVMLQDQGPDVKQGLPKQEVMNNTQNI